MEINAVIVSDHAHVSGGSAQVALGSAKALAARGVSVTLFSAVGPPDHTLEAAGVRVICLNEKPYNRGASVGRAVFAGLWDKGAARAFEKVLKEEPHGRTVVHFHSFVDALSASVPAVAAQSGHPVAFSLHDYNFGCPYGGFYDYRREKICPLIGLSTACWMTNCSQNPYPRKLWRNTRLSIQKKRLDLTGTTFVFISDFSKRIINSYLPLVTSRAMVLNPIEVDKAAPAKPSRARKCGFLGRLSFEKGAHVFARAAAENQISALFIGDGPLKEKVSEICPSAEITGWLPRSKAHARLRECRAVVFPSVWYEASPLAVQEAMALGLPVVVSDACAGSDAVEPDVTGLLFRSADSGDLASRIRQLGNDELADRLGAAAYERFWADPPTMDNHVDALLRLYSSMLRGWA